MRLMVRPLRRDLPPRKAPMLRIRIGLLAAAALAFAVVSTGQASAADATAFWGYWQANGSKWAFAQTGPASAHPKDGAVEGWRFAKSTGDSGTPPRDLPDFAKTCGSIPAKSGSKRVAVVVDAGEKADAPKGQQPVAAKSACAVVPENASGADVLSAVAKAQTDKSGLVCAIDTYGPCGTPVAASHSTEAEPKKKGPHYTFPVMIGVVVAVVFAIVTIQRRRR